MSCSSLLERWNTPIAQASSVVIESIEADGNLSITLRATVSRHVLLICFTFLNYKWYQIKKFAPAYNIKAGRTQVHSLAKEIELGSSSILNLRALKKAVFGSSNCLLESLPSSSNHFVFVEDNSEIEVISKEQPTIRLIGKAPRNENLFDFAS